MHGWRLAEGLKGPEVRKPPDQNINTSSKNGGIIVMKTRDISLGFRMVQRKTFLCGGRMAL
jgi:hypothetical protein